MKVKMWGILRRIFRNAELLVLFIVITWDVLGISGECGARWSFVKSLVFQSVVRIRLRIISLLKVAIFLNTTFTVEYCTTLDFV